jgi:hypothetical protein
VRAPRSARRASAIDFIELSGLTSGRGLDHRRFFNDFNAASATCRPSAPFFSLVSASPRLSLERSVSESLDIVAVSGVVLFPTALRPRSPGAFPASARGLLMPHRLSSEGDTMNIRLPTATEHHGRMELTVLQLAPPWLSDLPSFF